MLLRPRDLCRSRSLKGSQSLWVCESGEPDSLDGKLYPAFWQHNYAYLTCICWREWGTSCGADKPCQRIAFAQSSKLLEPVPRGVDTIQTCSPKKMRLQRNKGCRRCFCPTIFFFCGTSRRLHTMIFKLVLAMPLLFHVPQGGQAASLKVSGVGQGVNRALAYPVRTQPYLFLWLR